MATQYTTVLRLRMLPEDYATVKAKAEAYRQPLSAFARNAICGIPMVCHLDEDAVEMLVRLGGLAVWKPQKTTFGGFNLPVEAPFERHQSISENVWIILLERNNSQLDLT
uniref:Uncharacterized protein n=1 Tax=mine drainage metagenome TaxID=410659 RepID=E6QNL2_9ZZZZ